MKKHTFIYLFKYLFICLFIGISIISCEKDKENIGPLVFQNKNLQSDLMKEKLVIQMLSDLKSYNIKVNRHGLLEFNSAADINEVLDTLQYYSHKFDDLKEKYPVEPMLLAFETAYGFNSLRAEIEAEIVALELRENLTENNDPDNYYIVSDFFRTILNPQNEVVINGLICVYLDEVAVGIMDDNYNALDDLHANLNKYPDEETAATQTAMSNSSCFMLDGESGCMAQFTYTQDASNPLKYHFANQSYNISWSDMTYGWDFGDGNHATIKDPNHTFTTGGLHYVTLTVYINGNISAEITKDININSCNADFNCTMGANGKVYFTNTSETISAATTYSWNFDDSGTSTIESPEHTYSADGTYSVNLTITGGGCTDAYTLDINITNADDYCKGNDKEIWEYDEYILDERKAKYVFKARNIYPFHRVIMKTVNYKIKNNGNLIRTRADVIGADYYGILYDTDCNISQTMNLYPDMHIENNKKLASYYEAIGYAYRIRKESIISWHKVKDEGVTRVGHWLKLHNDD